MTQPMWRVLVLCAAAALWACGQTCIDEDEDGYGSFCGQGLDCDDSNATIFPGAPETCNGLDDDCDGRVDEIEECRCKDGTVQSCFLGESRLRGKGVCTEGTQRCVAGAWGPCEGSGAPRAEACNGVDDDCNGPVDDVAEACYSGPASTRDVGVCRSGFRMCSDGKFSAACEGEVLPSAERCNALDDNCNGLIDEDVSEACFNGPPAARNKGICRDGTRVCTSGTWGACAGEVLPAIEICNNQDDDCDGAVDGMSRTCYSGPSNTVGVGRCRAGVQTCTTGQYGTCANEVLPATEACNNQDDDCDGVVDDGVTFTCYTGPEGTLNVGACRAGTATCTNGQQGTCQGQVTPVLEVCGNSADDNCNGIVDEGCQAGDGEQCTNAIPFGSGSDVTLAGNTTAVSEANYTTCGGTTSPDIVYTFTLPSTTALTQVTLDLTPDSTWAGALELLREDTSCPGTQVACVNSGITGAQQSLARELAPGTYHVVVKPSSGTGGAFTLRLRRKPVPSYVKSTSPTTYVDACTGGSSYLAYSDDSSASITLPFAFPFYGSTRAQGSTLYLASNGFISFGFDGTTGITARSNTTLPSSSTPNNGLFAFWDDLVTRGQGICVRTLGSAGSRQLAIEWRDAYLYGDSSTHLTFEILLHEVDGTIDFIYQSLSSTSASTGGSATVGVENADGTRATLHSYNTPGAVSSGMALRFTPSL